MTEWPNGGMKFPKQDIRSPGDFAAMAKLVRPEDFKGRMLISSDPEAHRKEIQKFLDMGFHQIYLHNVGRNQEEWIEGFGREVLPKLVRRSGLRPPRRSCRFPVRGVRRAMQAALPRGRGRVAASRPRFPSRITACDARREFAPLPRAIHARLPAVDTAPALSTIAPSHD